LDNARPEPVVIGPEGRKWWEFPDAMLPPAYGPSIFDGLWEKCGRKFFDEHIGTEDGLQAIKQVIGKIQEMGLEQTPPGKAKSLVEGKFMDDFLAKFTI